METINSLIMCNILQHYLRTTLAWELCVSSLQCSGLGYPESRKFPSENKKKAWMKKSKYANDSASDHVILQWAGMSETSFGTLNLISWLVFAVCVWVCERTLLEILNISEGFDANKFTCVMSSCLSPQDTVSDRECCNVTCKCSGHEGIRGSRGPPGLKVTAKPHAC